MPLDRYEVLSRIPGWRELYVAKDRVLGRVVTLETIRLADTTELEQISRALRARAVSHDAAWFAIHEWAHVDSQMTVVVENVCEDAWNDVRADRISERLQAGTVSLPQAAAITLALCRLAQSTWLSDIALGHVTPQDVWISGDDFKPSVRVWPRPYTTNDLRRVIAADPDERAAIAPELLADESPNHQSDVFALAAFFGRLLKRCGLTTADDPSNVVARCLAHAPSARPPLEEFIQLLERVAADSETRASNGLSTIDNAQFTVYRPSVVVAGVWYPLLAFAHPDAPEDVAAGNELEPLEEVRRQAEKILGEKLSESVHVTQDSSQSIPRRGEITFVPQIPDVECNPPSRSFRWIEAVHREEFRVRALRVPPGQMTRGRLTVYWGSVIVADVPLTIRIAAANTESAVTATHPSVESDRSRRYRKIFASYSHKDKDIVEQFERLSSALGDRYLRDVTMLNAGEVWSTAIEALIRQADVFQLFWSSNALRSPFVRTEWEYALSLNRTGFIRPTYWEEPLPSDVERDLPPAPLRRLHFQKLAINRPPEADPIQMSLPSPVPSRGGDYGMNHTLLYAMLIVGLALLTFLIWKF